MKQCTRGLRTAFAVFGCVLAFSGVHADESFTFDDIHFWVGEGTNRAAVVIDWNNGQPGSSLAWGIRWNGPSTNVAHLLQVLAHEDRRLHAALASESWGTWVLGFAYDADGDGGAFDMDGGRATDRDDYVGVDDFSSSYYWTLVTANTAVLTQGTTWNYGSGADYVYPADGTWIALKRVNWRTGESTVPAVPVFAETPFAYQVVACVVNEDESGSYSDPATVLGSPSTVARGYPPWSSDAPVVPCNPAWSSDQLLTLSKTEENTGGYVVIAFDHPVMDDPQNPFGSDFIVFGNAFQTLGGGPYFVETTDPSGYVFTAASTVMVEPALVEVSQDGVNWFSYSDGSYADTFAPTMSHLYDTNAPDASLFTGNLWWGAKADPTLPVDPAVKGTNFVGRTLAEYAMLYNGSAGGTGFDIGGFDLPVDETTGQKWIQFVRVTSVSDSEEALWSEIDAFADVSPALPYDNWVRENYAWADVPDESVTGKGVMAVNGKPNYYNAAFGTAPDADPVESFAVSSFAVKDGKAVFTVPSAQVAYDVFRVGKASDVNGNYTDSLPSHEGTVVTENGFESVFSIPVDGTETKAFYKIGLSAE